MTKVAQVVASWDGVTTHPHRFGGTEFRLGRRELGHLHGDRLADLPFPKRVHDELIADGRARPHHWLPDSGWVSAPDRRRGRRDRAVPAVVRPRRRGRGPPGLGARGRAERLRDRVRGLAHGAGEGAGRPAGQQLLRRADHADRPDGVARVVEDRGGDARLPEHRLVALARDAQAADLLELARQRAAVTVRPVSRGSPSASTSSTTSAGAKASIALPRALACTGSSAPTSRICSVVSGRNAWWTTSTAAPCITPTRTAASIRAASRSAGTSERARSSLRSRYDVPSWSSPGPSWYLSESRSCSTNPCACSVRSRPCTVGTARSIRRASSVTPRRRGPLARVVRIRAARSTDWIVPVELPLGAFGIVESGARA
jgi:hypothetical protein